MDQLARDTLDRQRFLLIVFVVFAALALLLACIGVYGVLAYLTGLRVPEFGLRMAMGATAQDVMRLVLRQSLGMIAAGAAAGAAVSLATAQALVKLVEGVRPMDPVTFVCTVAVLALAALAASYVPARRAARVDPMRALRED